MKLLLFLFEFIGRKTKNKRKKVVNVLGEQGILKLHSIGYHMAILILYRLQI